jgi:uncharacterized protein (DUF885 family)
MKAASLVTTLFAFLTVGCSEPVTLDVESAVDTHASAIANEFFERAYTEQLAESPMSQSYLGIRDQNNKWDDFSSQQMDRDLAMARRHREELKMLVAPTELDPQTRLSYELFLKGIQRVEERYEFRHHTYPVNQMRGVQSDLPAFMINIHQVGNLADAEAYVSRLEKWGTVFEQVIEELELRADKGILAPRFVYEFVRNDCRNVLSGRPFDPNSDKDSTLLADFTGKLAPLELDLDVTQTLLTRAEAALTSVVKPAYESLLVAVDKLEAQADDRDGVWKLPHGERFYELALRHTTTTDKSADEIHNIGLAEVDRIHSEMRQIMTKVDFDGDLQAFFKFMETDPQFYYPDTEAGRALYLQEATALIETMKAELPASFGMLPKADLTVKAVEAFREQSAGKAFYQGPAPDGSRPGTYYANLYRMADMPVYQMEALAYHEGIPGHHMQIAISQELKDVPRFRRFGGYTAYTEGWGLYSEWLPTQMGRYQDPYSDFGRLAMELWRACRLVVDTGIHAKRWTRQQAIDYLIANTPNPESDIVKAIERYIVMPSQATAYKVGMMEIIALRRQAETELGERFDPREFHDTVLGSGALPLDILRALIEGYIAEKRATT